MMSKLRGKFLLVMVVCIIATWTVLPAFAAEKMLEVAPGVLRHETLILENPTGRCENPDNFNRWAPGMTTYSTGLQQLALDTLWYIDPDAGISTPWDNSLAVTKPIYNKDFTRMTAKLRKGIYWSDGVEFTADDVVYTVETCMAHPGVLAYGANFEVFVDKVYKTDDYTVVFELKKPNSRFHGLFTVRWSACFIMPKHIFEKVEDPVAFNFNPPVSLGPYVLKDYDKTGNWFLWERREDWQRTSLARFGMPQPKYALYINPGPSDKRVMAQIKHDLDVIHDIAPEGMITLAKKNPTSKGWFKGFPWAHPDPTLPALILNNERYPLNIKDVRWALTLLIDIVDVSLASYKGAATISAIAVPPTGGYLSWYFDSMEEWLGDFTLDIDIDGKPFHPYDSSATLRIAERARKDLGDIGNQVPTDPAEIKKALGYGWWKHAPDVAEKLLLRNGFTRDKAGKWLLPDGKPWKITLAVEGPARPIMTRGGTMIAEQWRKFGIDAKPVVIKLLWQSMSYGDGDAFMAWCIETWGGHPDLFWFLESWHSDYYKPSGEPVVFKNPMRFKNAELDSIIEGIQRLDFDDPKCLELGLEYVKVCVEEMPLIPLMSYNVFTVCDEYYWEGFPTFENPYTNPVPNWANSKYMFTMIRPKAVE
jgi:peptide/nickel transport system substrate-binding protein